MNFNDILKEIEQADPSVYEQQNDRRQVLKSFGSKVAVAALPFALGALFQKAQAKTTATDSIIQALNFALEMEYLAYNYYHTGNSTGGLIPAGDQPGFLTIENQKKAHINYLNGAVAALGGAAYTPKNYDPTAANPLYVVSGAYDFTGGAYKAEVFSKYEQFVMIAEIFEDTFVHGYKGEIETAVLNDTATLEVMMRLQCTTARSAAHVRFVRRNLGAGVALEHPAPWITNNIPPDAKYQAYYNGEDAISQQGIDISALTSVSGSIPYISATAAFDESKDRATVEGLLAPFIMK